MPRSSFLVLAFLLATTATAQQDMAEDFLRALVPLPPDAPTELSIEIEGCVYTSSVRNLDYCERSGQGAGDRIVREMLFLNEVESIEIWQSDDRTSIRFNLDIGDRTPRTSLADMLLGRSETLSEYAERMAELQDAANLRTQKYYGCSDGTELNRYPEHNPSVTVTELPASWDDFVDLVRECRGDRPFSVTLE